MDIKSFNPENYNDVKEIEGDMYKDAATFVRENKVVVVPASEVPEEIKYKKGEGWIGNEFFIFIDSQGNIAEVKFDYNKIASIDKQSGDWRDYRRQVVNELEKYGFNFKDASEEDFRIVTRLKHQYRKIGTLKGRQFDF